MTARNHVRPTLPKHMGPTTAFRSSRTAAREPSEPPHLFKKPSTKQVQCYERQAHRKVEGSGPAQAALRDLRRQNPRGRPVLRPGARIPPVSMFFGSGSRLRTGAHSRRHRPLLRWHLALLRHPLPCGGPRQLRLRPPAAPADPMHRSVVIIVPADSPYVNADQHHVGAGHGVPRVLRLQAGFMFLEAGFARGPARRSTCFSRASSTPASAASSSTPGASRGCSVPATACTA